MGNTTSKAEFVLELEDDMSEAAKSAAGALEKLRTSIDDDSRALAGMQKAMKNLQGGTVVNVAQFKQLKEQIDLKKVSIAQAQSSYIGLGGSFTKTASSGKGFGALLANLQKQTKAVPPPVAALGDTLKETAESSKGFGKQLAGLQKQVSGMPGPLGALGARFGALSGMLAGGGAIAGGVLAIVAALAALVVGTVAATVALYRYGTAQADVRRNELLRLEGLAKLRFWYQRIPGNAKEMQGAIDRVSASSALSRDKIAGYSEQLYRLGMRGGNLSKALEGVAIKASTQGDAAANVFAGWAATIGLAGGSVDKLVDKVKARLGGIADRQLASSTVQAEKLKEAYNALFNDLSMDKYLTAWQRVNALLGQSTYSGRALKQIVEHILQPLIDASTAAAPIVKRFFQGMILAALRTEIVILDLRLAFKRTFGDVDLFKGIDKMNTGLELGKIAVYGLAVVFGLLGLAIGSAMIAAFGPLLLVGYALFKLGWALGELVTWFEKTDFGKLGADLIDGIVKPLKAGYAIIDQTMAELAARMKQSLKAALGIASPSKVFADLGIEIPRGVVVGIERGTPEARAAAESVVTPRLAPSTGPAPSASPAGASGGRGGSVTVTVGEVHIHAASDSPRDLALDFKRELESIMQGVAMQLGAPEPEPDDGAAA